MFEYLIKENCTMQVNNAGVGGSVVKDIDLLPSVLLNRGVSIVAHLPRKILYYSSSLNCNILSIKELILNLITK